MTYGLCECCGQPGGTCRTCGARHIPCVDSGCERCHGRGEAFVLREPGTQNESWQVRFDGRVCSPTWRQKGPALAYLGALIRGERQPEYST